MQYAFYIDLTLYSARKSHRKNEKIVKEKKQKRKKRVKEREEKTREEEKKRGLNLVFSFVLC
jgi:hypothetical protein